MTHLISGGLLAASMLLGQPGDGPKTVVPQPPTIQATQPQRPILGWMNREDRPVLSRIQSWWKRDQQEPSPGKILPPRPNTIRETEPPPLSPPTKPLPQNNDFPRKLPNPLSKKTTDGDSVAQDIHLEPNEVKQATVQQTTPAVKSPISPRMANKVGRDEKFEWITGQLENENGNHVIYYASPETIDKYKGRMVLVPQQADMSKFRRGDLVSVRGELVQRQTPQGTVPVYRVTHAALIER